MKTMNVIVKVLAALAAIAGTVYVIATFGDKIVAWAKRILGCGCECDCECEDCDCECECEECECAEEVEEAAEEVAEEAAEEVAEEPAADEEVVEASDADFEG